MATTASLAGLTSIQRVQATTLQDVFPLGRTDQRAPTAGGPVDVAAKALGLKSEDVVARLQEGQSLGRIAADQGVARETLAAALRAGAPAELGARADADSIIGRVIDTVGLPQGAQGVRGNRATGAQAAPPPPDGAEERSTGVFGASLTTDQQSTLDRLAAMFGTDSSALLSGLRSGTLSLGDLIEQRNLSRSQVSSVLADGLLFDARI